MCELYYGDYVSFQVWSETPRRARKQHQCDGCEGTIAKGEPYLSNFTIFEGTPTREKMCATCWLAREEFSETHGGWLVAPSNLFAMLEHCIDTEDDEGEEETAEHWRQVLETLRARRAA